ncbi:IAA carboxylmethyltransferase 1 [Perilla frutescens var. hirtella]|nr:IAA carboxylmethyltransferase 1 [Perilla frutescens var. frutescens]KAH6775787.1 IAA carboxylmethyltransferase 1 [Perilla frutescens var. hirtella]
MGGNSIVTNINLERVLSMKGGKGEDSYHNNSQAQGHHARSTLPLLIEALNGVRLSSADAAFVVADLGCASGRNTIDTVEVIIKHMAERYKAAAQEPPEFSAFFCDLPSNDFNTLFQLLPFYAGETMEECLASNGCRSYFTAGVPGSFHRRLFPVKYVDFFYSAFSLHWISQVPEEVVDKTSTAYNEGRIFIHGAKEKTVNAYKKQFQSDLGGFLRSRSKELKTGGSMFVVFLGRTSSDPTDQGGAGLLFGTHYQDAWNDLVQEGIITSEKRDKFNIPVYAASVEELKEVVECDGSFTINKLQLIKGGSPLVVNHHHDAAEIGRALATTCRTVTGNLVDQHIGHELSHELFSRVATRAMAQAKDLLHHLQFYHILASLSLA